MRVTCGLVLACATRARGELAFSATFDEGVLAPFVTSSNDRYTGQPVTVTEGDDPAMLLTAANQHYGIAAPVSLAGGDGLVIQYEVTLTDGLVCGGAYLKLLEATPELDVASFDDKTPFVVMFGPDKCGSTDKVHFILRQKNPVSGVVSEHHLIKAPKSASDKKVHLYTAIVSAADDSLEILMDGESKFKGSLLESLEPPLAPFAEIDDVSDSKPADWVDAVKMDDPAASKPSDWDEDAPKTVLDETAVKPAGWLDDAPAVIPDPAASIPEDWDVEEDGDWEAPEIANPACAAGPGCGVWQRPTVPNPEYKGKWVCPKVDNPEYKGEWAPRKVANPDFFTLVTPSKSIPAVGAVAVEIWTTNQGISLDNFALGNDADDAKAFAAAFYAKKQVEDEAELKRQEEKKAKRAEKKQGKQGIHATILKLATDAQAFATERPAALVATLAAGAVALFLLCKPKCAKTQDAAPAAEPQAPADDAATEPQEPKPKTPRAD